MSYKTSLEDLENRVYDLISEVTGLPIKWGNTNSPKAKDEQYILIKATNFIEKGLGQDDSYSAEDKKISSKEWEVFFDIDCRRGRYTQAVLAQIIHTFQQHTETYFKYFHDHTSSFLRIQRGITPRDSTVDGEVWEERSRVTLAFNMVVVDTDLYSDGVIDTVEISHIRTKIGDTTVVDDSVTIEYP